VGGMTNRSSAGGAAGAAGTVGPGGPQASTGKRPSSRDNTSGALDLQLPPAPGDVAAAFLAAQQEALLVQWDRAARKGLAACAEQTVSWFLPPV
jgi:hypothetical protein